MKRTVICAHLIAIFLFYTLCSTQDFSKSSALSPLKMSYADFDSLLQKVLNFLSTANGKSFPEPSIHYLMVSDGQNKVTKRIDLTHINYTFFPNTAYNLVYTFFSSNMPISRVDIRLSDFSRDISIEGQKPDQVEALFALLQSEFDKYSILIGGFEFRFFLIFLLIVTVALILNVNFLPNQITPTTRGVVFLVMSALGISALFFPYDQWLSGFTIYSGEASFVRRYSAEISLGLGLLSLVFTILQSWRRPRQGSI